MAYTKADKDGSLPVKRNDKRIPAFPLEKVNVVQLAQDLSKMLDKPAPSSWLGKWFSNNKLELDNDRLSAIESYVTRVSTVNRSITNMQSELYLQPTVLQ